ncbi:MAG: hypothetical protein LT105_12640 [Lentimicrobium sp.]|nr:hypothetical protein [Lentimicrobium sp.]
MPGLHYTGKIKHSKNISDFYNDIFTVNYSGSAEKFRQELPFIMEEPTPEFCFSGRIAQMGNACWI